MKPAELLRTGVLAVVFGAAGLGAGVAPARAGVITLDVTGTMIPVNSVACSPTCTLGGTIVINNSPPDPGVVISEDVTATGFSPSVGPFTQNSFILKELGATALVIDDAALHILDLVFLTPTAGSLVGYTGGPLTTITSITTLGNPQLWGLTSGALTAQTAVLEPPSLLLLLSALAGLGGLLGRRLLPPRPACRG